MGHVADLALAGLLSLGLSAVPAAGEAPSPEALPPPPRIVMQVGGRYVTTLQIERELAIVYRPRVARRIQMMKAGSWTDADESGFAAERDELARQLVSVLRTRAIMEEAARSRGQRPDELRIEEHLRRVAAQAGGVDALVRAEGRTLEEIRDGLRGEDMRAKFERDLVPDLLPPGPREIREYFAAHRGEMKAPAKVRLRILFLAKGGDAAGARAAADELRRELQFAPDRFERRARERSQHRQTAERGGLITIETGGEQIEWIGADVLLRMNPQLARAASVLSPGQVSDVIDFEDGYALVKLEGLREGGPLGIAEAADPVKERLARERRERLLTDWVAYYMKSTYLADGLGRRIDVDVRGGP